MSTVIKVEHLSKEYRLGTIGHNYLFRDLQSAWARFRGKEDPNRKLGSGQISTGQYMALNDVSFEVKEGEVLGIIGRNGAGKSTLLKILSRITTPTKGTVKVKGRVASLLEVGTGFHPELTGRENIFLNGAILGMTKPEIRAKFDEIVDFSGIEQFIDTPVKRYSSGMYVRLAFAVAAHLEPEILIIDEVLAVGDAEFQKKCLGKMKDVAGEGRTVLFVSHNMAAVQNLCGRGMLLERGVIKINSKTENVIEEYLKRNIVVIKETEIFFEPNLQKDFQIMAVQLTDENSIKQDTFECDVDIHIVIQVMVRKIIPGIYGYLAIMNDLEETILESDSQEVGENIFSNLPEGKHSIVIQIPKRHLGHGRYTVYLNFASSFNVDGFHVDSPGKVCAFHVVDSTSNRGNSRNGFFSTLLNWGFTNNAKQLQGKTNP